MPKDPYEAIAKPVNDPYAAIAAGGSTPSQSSENPLLGFGKGILKGVVHTMSAADDFAAKHLPAFMTTPIGQAPTAENSARAVQYAKDLATPRTTAQSLGRTAEQVGEFFLPSGAEKGAASLLTKLVPSAAGLALPAARVVGGALVNKAQGGSLAAGLAAGVGGEAIGAGLKAAAPSVANIALRPGRLGRAFGKDAGTAMLTDTTGIRPESINASATSKISSLSQGNDMRAAFHPNTVSTQPGLDVIDNAIAKLEATNSKGPSIDQLRQVRTNLTVPPTNPSLIAPATATPMQAGEQFFTKPAVMGTAQKTVTSPTGAVTTRTVPKVITPSSLLTDQSALATQNLKRGLRTDYVSNFDPTNMKGTREVAFDASGAIDKSLDAALGPEYAKTNDRISSLFSVKDATERRMLDPSLLEKYGSKLGAHTGALTGGFFGAREGEKYGGGAGALIGGAAGFAAPELLLSPEAQAIAARTMFSPKTRGLVLPALKASGLQFTRGDQ